MKNTTYPPGASLNWLLQENMNLEPNPVYGKKEGVVDIVFEHAPMIQWNATRDWV